VPGAPETAGKAVLSRFAIELWAIWSGRVVDLMLLVDSKNGPIRDLATMRELSTRLQELADQIDDHGASL
jgi:hypothetical protein